MYGIYIKYHNPFGKYYIGVYPSLDLIAVAIRNATGQKISGRELTATFVATNSFNKIINNIEVVVTEVSTELIDLCTKHKNGQPVRVRTDLLP